MIFFIVARSKCQEWSYLGNYLSEIKSRSHLVFSKHAIPTTFVDCNANGFSSSNNAFHCYNYLENYQTKSIWFWWDEMRCLLCVCTIVSFGDRGAKLIDDNNDNFLLPSFHRDCPLVCCYTPSCSSCSCHLWANNKEEINSTLIEQKSI